MADKIDNGGRAFPNSKGTMFMDKERGAWGIEYANGMTLRQWYAGQAFLAAAVSVPGDAEKASPKAIAERAFALADAMIAEGRKT